MMAAFERWVCDRLVCVRHTRLLAAYTLRQRAQLRDKTGQ